MSMQRLSALVGIVAIQAFFLSAETSARPSMGRVGGGGARPSMGGGGGMRPNMGGGMGGMRPSPNMNMSRPSPNIGNMSRPTNMTRPGGGANARPSTPNFHPGGTRPSPGGAGGNLANRPNVRPPGNLPSTVRPSGNRPTTLPGNNALPGGNQRPNLAGNGNRPTTLPGNVNRPTPGGNPNRPTTLPGNVNRPTPGGNPNRPTTLPGQVTRPNIPGGRPGGRPTTLPGDVTRPGIGNITRPGTGGINRPYPNRPIVGGNRPGQTVIGSGNNNFNNININNNHFNNINVSTRPAWDHSNWNGGNWGLGGGTWHDQWHNNCINQHHGWYNGCWSGRYWTSAWYTPLAWTAVGWGLNSWTNSWGYGYQYVNPYYTVAATSASPYNYAQPVVVNNYVSANDSGSNDQPAAAPGDPGNTASAPAAPPADPASDQGLQRFDEGLALFKQGQYAQSIPKFDAALKLLPSDPVVHEVRALALFATGNYAQAAPALNALLAAAPGMDWTTLSGLYGNVDDYTAQLRNLEQYCKANPRDAAAHFVASYHYLILGAKDNAIHALKIVVANQPKDSTAKRMLDALAPPTPPSPSSAAPDPSSVAAAAASDGATDSPDNQPETDLVGTWKSSSKDATIELTISENFQFTWKATQGAKPPITLQGNMSLEGDTLALQTESAGQIDGAVKSAGPDQWSLALTGAPANDPGLQFQRVK